MKTSNTVETFKNTLSGDDILIFNNYIDAISSLLRAYSGSGVERVDTDNSYDITYSFETEENAINFYNALESNTASSVITEYKNLKQNTNGNGAINQIIVLYKPSNSEDYIVLKTIAL